jgi:hypothetical protein
MFSNKLIHIFEADSLLEAKDFSNGGLYTL